MLMLLVLAPMSGRGTLLALCCQPSAGNVLLRTALVQAVQRFGMSCSEMLQTCSSVFWTMNKRSARFVLPDIGVMYPS
jgi:hypothetical protein